MRNGTGLVTTGTPWRVGFTKRAQKDARKLAESKLRLAAEELLASLARSSWATPLPFEKLIGDLAGAYSRRINIQHRLVYQALEQARVVKVVRMWTHFD